MKTELAKVQTEQLEVIVKNSGLEIKEGELIKQSYLPFLDELAMIQAEAQKLNYENPTEIDEINAHALRMKTVKVRTSSEALKDNRKKTYLLRGNLEQAAYNLIAASCKLTEDVLINVEKAREIAERERLAKLKAERNAILAEVCENPNLYQVEIMTEDAFKNLVAGQKLVKEQAEAEAKKAEEDLLEAQRIEAERIEQLRLDNIRLQKEAEAKAKQVEAEHKANEAKLAKLEAEIKARQKIADEFKAKELKDKQRNEELRPYVVFIRDYSAMLNMSDKEYQKELADIKKGAELQWEYDRKQAIELKVKQDAEAKALADKLADEKKAASAPDKQKLIALANAFENIKMPELKTAEALDILTSIAGLISKLVIYINQKAETL